MKLILITFILLSFSCNPQSSPDGRSMLRDKVLQAEIDSLKRQNKAILDSIAHINKAISIQKHQ